MSKEKYIEEIVFGMHSVAGLVFCRGETRPCGWALSLGGSRFKTGSALYPRVERGILYSKPLLLRGAVGTSGTATAAAADNECSA